MMKTGESGNWKSKIDGWERRKNQKEEGDVGGSYRRPETRIHSDEGSSQIHFDKVNFNNTTKKTNPASNQPMSVL